MSDVPASHSLSRGRIIGVRALLVLGVLLSVLSILSTYVKREALDTDRFKQTSRALIADPLIQEQVAARLVDAFYTKVDVSAELKDALPTNLKPLAGPLTGLSRGFADTAAQKLLTRSSAQDAFVELASLSQSQVVKILQGNTRVVSTTNGNVVLDLTPLVLKFGDRFGFVSNLADKIPQGSAQITIVNADGLDTAQTITRWLEQVANYIWILAVAAWVGAIWLARGRRRQEVRALGIGLIAVGILVLVLRFFAGKYFVENLVTSEAARPAASDAWQIITKALADAGWVTFAVGALVALGAWLIGHGQRATSVRSAVAPALSRTGVAWASYAVIIFLLIWILPIQMFRTSVGLVLLSAIGFVILRRQVAAEAGSAPVADTASAAPLDPPAPPG
ncbi:MAG: hypothetical protein EXQ81_00650 [Thermoleophilia bacterium]|nr:hypothetical protein [Thermoleophilia bacterium]